MPTHSTSHGTFPSGTTSFAADLVDTGSVPAGALIIASCLVDTGATQGAFGTPSGWEKLFADVGGTFAAVGTVFAKVATGGETTETFTIDQAGTWSVVVHVIESHNGIPTGAAKAISSLVSTGTDVDAPAVTMPVDGGMVLMGAMSLGFDAGGLDLSAPGGTPTVTVPTITGTYVSSNYAQQVAYHSQDAAATSARTFTSLASGQHKLAWSLAISPAQVGPIFSAGPTVDQITQGGARIRATGDLP